MTPLRAYIEGVGVIGPGLAGWPRLHALLASRLPHSVEARSYSGFLAGFVGRFLRGDESMMGFRRHDRLPGRAGS